MSLYREVCCSESRGKGVVSFYGFLLAVLIVFTIYGINSNFSQFIEMLSELHWSKLSIVLIILLIPLFIYGIFLRGICVMIKVGFKEWFSKSDWVVELTNESSLNFTRPIGTLGESFNINLLDVVCIKKVTENGSSDTCDVIKWFVILESGKEFYFDNYIPLDLDLLFKKVIENYPVIKYMESEV